MRKVLKTVKDMLTIKMSTINLNGTLPGVCISGGIDSTVILHHVVNDLMNGDGNSVDTFTVIFGNEYDETEKARRIAKTYGTNHHEILMDKNYLVSMFPEFMKHYDFPRYNIWMWGLMNKLHSQHLFIGEGSDEMFGYSDRSFYQGWADHLIWVMPAWEVAAKYYGISLHCPFKLLEDVGNIFYLPPNKQILRDVYTGIIPAFAVQEPKVPPSHGFYKMMGMTKEELRVMACEVWLEVHGRINK